MSDELKKAVKSSIGWVELADYDSDPTDADSQRKGLCFVNGTLRKWTGTQWVDADTVENIIGSDRIASITAANGNSGVPIVIPVTNTGAASITIFNGNAPFKMRIIDAWAISTKATNSGNWNITDGTNDITSAIAYSTSDKGISRATTLDDANYTINANGTLKLVSSEETDKAVVYISAIKVS